MPDNNTPQIERDSKGRIIKGTPQDTNKNGTAGAPTKYDDKFIEEVNVYLAEENKKERSFPTIEGFALHIGVDHDTVNNWANARIKDEQGRKTKKRKHPEFFGAIKRLKTAQKEKLIVDGFYGGKNVNAIMGIFLLKNNHGMVETLQTDITTKGKELPVPLLGGVGNVSTDDSSQ